MTSSHSEVVSAPEVDEALQAFGKPAQRLPPRPIIHGAEGSLLTFAVPDEEGRRHLIAVWVRPDGVRFLPPTPLTSRGASGAHGLRGAAAELFDRWVEAARAFHEATESVDSQVSELEARGATIPTSEIWRLQRTTAGLRAQIGRAMVVASECAGPLSPSFKGLAEALPSLLAELGRIQSLSASVQQSLSDLVLLRTAQESNRIAEAANELARTSNRIAELANTSNIRMLGLTYIALVLGLVSAAVLIPNTAATILGMPSAAWVPGPWVDVILVLLMIAPIVVIFSRPWVHRLLAHLRDSEARAAEGLRDLPEEKERAARRPPDAPAAP